MKFVFISCYICLFSSVIFSQVTVEMRRASNSAIIESPKPIIPVVLMIDDFEDANITEFREWWTFDKAVRLKNGI